MSEREQERDPEIARTLGLGAGKRVYRRWIGLGVVLLVLLGAGLGIRHWLAQRALAARPTYQLEKVARTDIEVLISATGTLKGRSTVEVGAEVSGRVTEVMVDFNDRVTRGQLLAVIDPEQLQASVAEAEARVRESEASIRQAKATLLEARRALERAQTEGREGLVSQRDLETAEAARERAEATLLSAQASATLVRASLESQRSRLDKTRIVSPIDGIVLARSVEPGQTVTAGFQTPLLFKLTEDLRRMELLVYVDEADVGRAREGQAASFTVDAYPDRTFPSKLLSLRNEPKQEQNVVTYEAVLQVDNSELLLRPGMTATATITAEVRPQVLSVPNAALRFAPPESEESERAKPGERRVWVLRGEPPTPEPVPVKTGVSDGRATELRGGALTEGAEVIVDAVFRTPQRRGER